MSTSEQGDAGQDAALRLLADLLGTADLRVVGETHEVLPDGRAPRRIWAASAAEPSVTESVVVDAEGTPLDPGEIEASIGRRLLLPSVGAAAVGSDRTPVSIDPPSVDLVLAESTHVDEHITVAIPVSGATPKADVYLLSDTTASMGPVIDAVKAGVGLIVGNPALAGFDVAYGVGNYRDFPIGPGLNSYAFRHQLAPTTNATQITAAVSTWTADEGEDHPEGQLFALQQLAEDPAIGWRPNARRIVVWFGDAPGHDPICAAISGLGADITEGTATAALQAANTTVVAVSTTTGMRDAMDGDPTANTGDYDDVCTVGGTPGQATRITGATGGSHTTGIDAGTIVTTLAAVIAAAVTSTGNVNLAASTSIADFLTGINPPGGHGPLPGDVAHDDLEFDAAWAGARECRDEPQVIDGTLDVVADGAIVASQEVTITVPACRYHHVVDVLCGRQEPPKEGKCSTIVPGRYATAVTIYNPGPRVAVVEERFAPLLHHDQPASREPRTVDAGPLATIELQPGEAMLDGCCSLGQAVRLDPAASLGVLDLVSNCPLVVTGVYSSTGSGDRVAVAAGVHTRTVEPLRR